MNKAIVETCLAELGIGDFRWVNPKTDVPVYQWVRFHCMFGCQDYGVCGTCAPIVPSVAVCREMLSEYDHALLIHEHMPYEDAESYRKQAALLSRRHLKAEKSLFLNGFYKAFLLPFTNCLICPECAAKNGNRSACRNKRDSRPGIEAVGIDVYETARKAGYHIEVVRERGDPTDRFSLLLVE